MAEVKKVRVLLKNPGEEPVFVEIETTLIAMQRLVGGMIELVYHPDLPRGAHMYCNEEGKFAGLAPNLFLNPDILVGPAFFCGHTRSGNTADLPTTTHKQILAFIKERGLP